MEHVTIERGPDPGLLDFLRSWHAEPPEDFHRDGVAFVVEYLGRFAP